MATMIADTAQVDPRAELGEDVEVGPYCVIGPDVKIGGGTRLIGQVCLMGDVTIGEGNTISPFAVIGGDPQDLSYRGEPTRVEIGDHNVIRESVTINRATTKEEGVTRVGSHNYFMAGSHVAHDCQLGDRITVANSTMLGGHVRVESHASISGGVAVHHFVSIGGYSFVGGQSRIVQDVAPFMLVEGNPQRVRCINVVGLKRNGLSREAIDGLNAAYRLLYRSKMAPERVAAVLEPQGEITPEVVRLLDFLIFQRGGKHGRGLERRG
jgi:UDP-N-acetylglucosamine acyltransferase